MVRKLKYKLPEGIVAAPMPRSIKPMYAVLANLPADQHQYGFEYKWDGVRAIFFWDGSRPIIQSRNLNDITQQYPEIVEIAGLGLPPIIFDGEIITLDRDGRPSFNLLQQRFSIADPAEALKCSRQIPAIYMIFDILYIERYSLLKKVYTERRALLDQFKIAGSGMADSAPGIRARALLCCKRLQT